MWLEDHLARYGPWRTARQFMGEVVEFARDSTPSRRRQRYGDIEFDCDFRVDTTAATVPLRSRVLGMLAGGLYQPTEPAAFHQMMAELSLDWRPFTFIDVGSGKGRVLLMASDYPFRRILGLEILPELCRVAEENFRQYKSPRQQCFQIESWCGDARDFVFPPEPTLLYLFNPCLESSLAAVIANLERSLQQYPRPVFVVYHNPEREHVLALSPSLRRVSSTCQFAVYAPAGDWPAYNGAMAGPASHDGFARLLGHRYLSLTTFRKTGKPVLTPVWFAANGDTLFVMTRSDSGKYKRICNSPRVEVAPCTARGRITGAATAGIVRILGGEEAARAREVLRRKYWLLRIPWVWSRKNMFLEIKPVTAPEEAPGRDAD